MGRSVHLVRAIIAEAAMAGPGRDVHYFNHCRCLDRSASVAPPQIALAAAGHLIARPTNDSECPAAAGIGGRSAGGRLVESRDPEDLDRTRSRDDPTRESTDLALPGRAARLGRGGRRPGHHGRLCKAADEKTLPDLPTDDDLWKYVRTVIRHQVLLARDRYRRSSGAKVSAQRRRPRPTHRRGPLA